MDWSSRPLVRIFILFATGVFIAWHFPGYHRPGYSFYALLGGSVVVAFLMACRPVKKRYSSFQGFLYAILITFLGYGVAILQISNGDFAYPKEKSTYCGRIVSHPIIKDNNLRSVLLVRELDDKSPWKKKGSKVMAFLQGGATKSSLQVGDRIVFEGQLSRPVAPKNPDEFNYAGFLRLNGINHTVFVSFGNWRVLEFSSGWSLKRLAGKIRVHFLDILQDKGIVGEEYDVTAAILLGYDESMSMDLRQDFVNAGAMHILCVSGLHVGVIYLVINSLLFFLRRTKSQRLLKVLILLLVVWSYAVVTGLSPSVQRAAVMISLFILGNNLNKSRDPYNTLAGSAVVLLALDPLMLFNVGFQLSYSAVFGILTFHKPLHQLIHFQNKFADKFYSIFVLSIAAQLGTFPLALYYFHFFPTYFWLSNLVIFPLSFLIISGGFIFLVLSWVPWLSGLLGQILSTLVYLLNNTVGLVEYLPFHGLDDIHFPLFMVLLTYGLTICSFMVFFKKKVKFLKMIFLLLVIIIGFACYQQYRILEQRRIVVYSIRNHTAVDFIDGGHCYSLMDSVLVKDEKKQGYHLQGARLNWGLKKLVHINSDVVNNSGSILLRKNNFYQFHGKRILIEDGSLNYPGSKTWKITMDVIVLTGRNALDLSKLVSYFDLDLLVMDASVPHWKRKKILKQSEALGIEVWDVKERGAFILEL